MKKSLPPLPPPEDTKDFGLGSKVTGLTRARFLNKDGSFNVERTGETFIL